MADVGRLLTLTDDALGDALRGLGAELDVPASLRVRWRGPGAAGPPPDRGRGCSAARFLDRPPRPAGCRRRPAPVAAELVLAVAALLVLAAIAGAIGFGLPGLRIVFGPVVSPTAGISPAPSTLGGSPGPSAARPPGATPSSGPPGSGLGLGTPTTLAAARAETGSRSSCRAIRRSARRTRSGSTTSAG